MVDKVHLHMKAQLRTMRFDPIDKTAVTVNVKTLLEACLVKHCAFSSTKFIIDVARPTSKFQTSMYKTNTVLARNWERPGAHERKADAMLLGEGWICLTKRLFVWDK